MVLLTFLLTPRTFFIMSSRYANRWYKKPFKAPRKKDSARSTQSVPFSAQVPTIKYRIPRALKMRERSNLTNFTRQLESNQLILNSNIANGYGFVFTLNMLPNYTDFTGLYDRYRILKVEITLMPTFNSSDPTTTADGNYPIVGSGNFYIPWVMVAEDWDQASPPTSESQMLTYDNMRLLTMDKTKKFTVYPRPLLVTTSGLYADAGGSNGEPTWCSTQFAGVNHYGLRLLTGPNAFNPGANPPTIRVFMKFFFQCQGAL